MKRIAIVMLALCSIEINAATPKKNNKPAASARKAAAVPAQKPAPPAVVIPADATRVDEYTYTHTDAQGKTWTYRKTPFGIQKSERTAETAAPYPLPEVTRDRQSPFAAEGSQNGPATTAEQVIAVESGDTVTFRRRTPFGNNSWTKKKSELNEEEKALLERAKAK
ncbi:MAG TPA: hypothetical protein VFL57_04610 [Bryobacteraceae bacterium]|nr:hypothetical protein [Bryobacteraceae bacterium]